MTGRRDPSARDAIEYAADAGVLPAPVLDVSGPCIRGTHSACPITARDGTACQCYCHAPGGWGEPEPTRHDRPAARPQRHERRTNL